MSLRGNLNTALSGVEICAADRPIRAFGMIADGEVTFVSAVDCWSQVREGKREPGGMVELRYIDDVTARCNPEGGDNVVDIYRHHNRWFKDERWQWDAVENPEESTVSSMSAHAAVRGSHEYIEMFFRAAELKALWVKDWADPATKRAAAILAIHRAVPLVTVKGADRIADIADQIGLNETPGNDNYVTPTFGDMVNV